MLNFKYLGVEQFLRNRQRCKLEAVKAFINNWFEKLCSGVYDQDPSRSGRLPEVNCCITGGTAYYLFGFPVAQRSELIEVPPSTSFYCKI